MTGMSCVSECIKWLLFVFNFIFALCGLAILVVGVIVHLKLTSLAETVTENVMFPSVTLIVAGSIIFIIAFFGCCGAIRESHCMTITFASLLLTILIIQVAVAVYAFVVLKNADTENTSIRENYQKIFNNYWAQPSDRELVDVVQSTLGCCGVDSAVDYAPHSGGFNGTVPWSCCGKPEGEVCTASTKIYTTGCVKGIKEFFKYAGTVLGGIALGTAGVELVGIIFALCLANSIRNAERRGYRV